MSHSDLLVVGGGLAGLGAALAVSRARPDWRLTLLEQATEFGEVGAGIQLGPNAVRVLEDWGLAEALRECAAFPEDLQVRDVPTGATLGRLPLGQRAEARYGAPYATIHRADLHEALLNAVHATGQVQTHLGQRVAAVETQDVGSVRVTVDSGQTWGAGAMLACDGVWSRVREQLWHDGPATFTGDLAYRGMVPMADLPAPLRRSAVTAWLGERCHVVHYPVRGGLWMNVVAVVQGTLPAEPIHWDHAAHAADLLCALGGIHPDLHEVLGGVLHWRLWPLFARPPLRSAAGQVQGAVALLGDAAHPMRPYLAQGAAMALEDAWALGQHLSRQPEAPDWPALLARWASQRWARNAWVQERSRRNGWVFHLDGPLRWGRNLAMATLGARLLDVPRLYSGPPWPT